MAERKSLKQRVEWTVIVWLARRLPDCKTMTEKMGRALDEGSGLHDRIIQRLHLYTCQACRRYLEQIKFLKQAFQFREKEFVGEGLPLSKDAKERIKARLRTLS